MYFKKVSLEASKEEIIEYPLGFGFFVENSFVLDSGIDKIFLDVGLSSNFFVNIFYPLINIIICWIIHSLIKIIYNKKKEKINNEIL
jgi:hypothetical protein